MWKRFLNESEELDKNLLDGDNIEFIENEESGYFSNSSSKDTDKHQTDTSGNWVNSPTRIISEAFVTMDKKNVNEGLTTACFNIPQTISEAIDIMDKIYESDENERSYITTACSRCKKRHIKCDDQSPSCQNCKEKGHECIRIPQKLSRGRPQGTLNGQGKSLKKNTNNGAKKTRKPRIKRLNKSNDVKDIIKELLNHEGVDVDGNDNNDPLDFYNELTSYSSFQSTSPTPSYSFTSSHDTYDINNNNTVYRSSNLTDSPIQTPFSFFDTSKRYNAHQLQIPIPSEKISDFVLGPNALTTNVDLDIANYNYDGEVDPIQFRHLLMHGSLDSYNSSTPMNEQYVDYLKTASISNTNVANVGLKTYCLGIPQTISKVIDIMNDIYESDENERSCVTTACSRCKKRHLKCDNQKPSCQNYEENGRIQPKISRGRP
nr:13755_t:CDS:2 [Entrophospora candida]